MFTSFPLLYAVLSPSPPIHPSIPSATALSSNSSSIINYRLVPPSAHQEPGEMEWMQEATIAHPLGARLPLGVHQSVSAGRRFDLAEGEKECRNQRESCTRLCPPPSPHLIYKRINSPIEN
ncbi:hypothetical protein OUZ56_004399 [Daphnia magna]|uniref:Uncharacterized protein n=1 Tax=Daphnia magna TaxID=35525 RepID=A0ABQ9YPQ5_9CRUS|nr:hypothetical protein OUZ56_004399 [Daphnia magna]